MRSVILGLSVAVSTACPHPLVAQDMIDVQVRARDLVSYCQSIGGCEGVIDFGTIDTPLGSTEVVRVNPGLCDEGGFGAGLPVCEGDRVSIECLINPAACLPMAPHCQLIPCAPGCPGSSDADCPQPYLKAIESVETVDRSAAGCYFDLDWGGTCCLSSPDGATWCEVR